MTTNQPLTAGGEPAVLISNDLTVTNPVFIDPPPAKRIAFGSTAKSIGGNRYGGYLVKFTDADTRDLQGEYFTADTDFCEQDYPIVGRPILYQHGLDPVIGIHTIGVIDKAEKRADGIWIEYENKFATRYRKTIDATIEPDEWKKQQYELADEYERAIDEIHQRGKMALSSGGFPQGVIIDETGCIRRWPIIEGSDTPTPAMPRDTVLVPIKSIPVIGLKELLAKEAPTTPEDEQKPVITQTQGTRKKMDMEKIRALLKELTDALAEEEMAEGDAAGAELLDKAETDAVAQAAADTAAEEEKEAGKAITEERLEEIVAAHMKAAFANKQKEKARKARLVADIRKTANGFGGEGKSKVPGYSPDTKAPRIEGGDNLKYAHLSASDMALGLKLALIPLQQTGELNPDPLRVVSEDYYRTMVGKMIDNPDHKAGTFNDYRGEHAPHPEWVKSVNLTNRALKSGIPFKSNELDASNIATQGQEWVGQWWESDIWLRAREVRIYQELIRKGMMQKDIPQGYSTAKFPIEGNDPTVYTAPEANSVDSTGRPEVTAKISPFTTGNVTLTPKEWKAATSYTVILGEDSIVDVASQVNYQMTEKIQETIEQGMINGDTATAANTNINSIDDTPGTGLSTPYYIAFDGFRKLPLVTATSYSRDASNGLSIEDYRATLQKFDSALRSRADRLCFIIDADTETASLAIPEIATDDVRHSFATITSGVLRNVYGVDVFKSGFLLLSNTAGKVATTTPANNKRGTILGIYAPYWGFGYKRQITVETARDILSGSNIYVMSLRLGVIARGSNAAALTYNIQNGNG